MGQKVNPIGIRLGYIKRWDSNWFENKKNFSKKLIEDHTIRTYIYKRVLKGEISKIIIERTLKKIILTIHTSKPGIVIGKGGTEVDKIKKELKKITNKEIQINIFEIKKPELDAKLVSQYISQQLKSKISFRRAMKQAITSTIKSGAKGIKIKISGRLGGAEMSRSEQYKKGRIPLHTLRADIDYAITELNTVYGKIGIKVWIFKKEIYKKQNIYNNYNNEKNKKKFIKKKNK